MQSTYSPPLVPRVYDAINKPPNHCKKIKTSSSLLCFSPIISALFRSLLWRCLYGAVVVGSCWERWLGNHIKGREQRYIRWRRREYTNSICIPTHSFSSSAFSLLSFSNQIIKLFICKSSKQNKTIVFDDEKKNPKQNYSFHGKSNSV